MSSRGFSHDLPNNIHRRLLHKELCSLLCEGFGMKTEFKKITHVNLPYNMTSEDASKNYGHSGLRITFVLEGPLGATQFMFSVPFYLQSTLDEWNKKYYSPDTKVLGYDVGYHSPKPMYEDQKPMSGKCEHVEGGTCYYDGSGLRADDWVREIFSIKGEKLEDTIWKKLEEEYNYRFIEKDAT